MPYYMRKRGRGVVNTAQAVLATLLNRGGDYAAYIHSLAPGLWLRLNELEGATAHNSGSLGAAADGTYTALTLAQQGKMSPTGAVLFNGTTSLITVPTSAALRVPTSTYAFLVKPSGAGEGNAGAFHYWGTANFNSYLNGSLNAIRGREAAATTTAESTTTTGLVTTAWTWIFRTYNDAGDRKIHYYKGINGVLTEFAYSGQTAAVGAASDKVSNLIIGNTSSAIQTWVGLMDEVLLWPGVILNTVQMSRICQLSEAANEIERTYFFFSSDIHVQQGVQTDGKTYAQQMIAAENPGLILFAGDIANTPYDLSDAAALMATATDHYSVKGNHEGVSDCNVSSYGMAGNYFSFNRGSVHFVMMDDVRTDWEGAGIIYADERTWLEADLAATTKPIIVLIMHCPPMHHFAGDSGLDWFDSDSYDWLAALVDLYPRVYIFAGHIHLERTATLGATHKPIYTSAGTIWGQYFKICLLWDGVQSEAIVNTVQLTL